MRSRHSRGVVEARSRCSRGAIAVWAKPMHDRDTPEPRPRHARGAVSGVVEVCSRCGRCLVVVQSRYASGVLPIRSTVSRSVWYFNILSGVTLNGVLPVWCGTLIFYRVVLYMYNIHILNVRPFGYRWDSKWN